MKSFGLRVEIVVSLVLLVVTAAGLMGLLVFKHAQSEMAAVQIEAGLGLARVAEARFRPDRPEDGLREIVGGLAAIGFERVWLVDPKGKVLVDSRGADAAGDRLEKLTRRALVERRVQTDVGPQRLGPWGESPTLVLAAPLLGEAGRIKGVVAMYSPLSQIRVAWERTRMILAVYLLLDTVIVVLFGSYLLSRRLVEPLKRLGERVKDLAEGRYHPGRLEASEKDEIGRLEESFERMAAQIIHQQSRLEENLESLQRAQDELVRSAKLATVGHLAAGLAHELGNPLASLLGFVHLLKSGRLTPDETLDFLGRMEKELGRMDGIIRSLLNFARSRPQGAGPVDLNRSAAEALSLAEVQKWFTGLEVQTRYQKDLPPAKAEGGAVTQVLLNLLANAGRAMNGQGRLTLATGREGEDVFVAVEDTGPGISLEDQKRIFEPFFTTRAPGEGTGLGLSVSLSLMESFGGRIDVVSQPGQGSTFRAVWPLYQEAPGGGG